MSEKIYAALAAVMADVGHVSKDQRNQQQGFNFRGIDAVVNAVGPALRKHQVTVLPNVEEVSYETVTTNKGATMHVCHVVVSYTFYADDGSSLSCTVAAESFDSGDKGTAKAMSVAFRTALLQALCLPTDEPDPDVYTYQVDRMTTDQNNTVKRLMGEKGVSKEYMLELATELTARPISSGSELTEAEGEALIKMLRDLPTATP